MIKRKSHHMFAFKSVVVGQVVDRAALSLGPSALQGQGISLLHPQKWWDHLCSSIVTVSWENACAWHITSSPNIVARIVLVIGFCSCCKKKKNCFPAIISYLMFVKLVLMG